MKQTLDLFTAVLLVAAVLLVLLAGAATRTEATTGICDRTPEVRDAILKALEADGCAVVDLADLTELNRVLSIHGTMLTSLKAGDFDGLGNLRWLDLSDNPLTTLPDDVFDGLDSLESLNLSYNLFATLPAGVFDGLSRLKWLALSHNQLTTLPESVFDGLGGLAGLRLDNNHLATLPAGAFDELGSLTSLWLHGNHLVGLTSDDPLFDALGRLPMATLNIFLDRQREAPAIRGT